MYLYLILVVIVIFSLKTLYFSILKPYALYKFYAKQLKQKNYRVYKYSFVPFTAPSIISTIREQKKYGDALWSPKYQGPDYDFVLTNIASQIILILINPKIIQQFYLLDATPTYIKEQTFITSLKRVAWNSITFSQGQIWKNKRRFMTNFFNFNYVNREIGTIANIVNRKLKDAQTKTENKGQFQVYMLELLEQMTSATMIELFFGGGSTAAEDLEIQGVKISTFMRILVEHLGQQALDPVSFLLGQNFPQKNLRAKDRLVTRQVQKFHEFTTNFIKNRIYQIKQGKSIKQDYVQKIYEAAKQQQRTPQFIAKVVSDFSSLYIAGTDTTSHSGMMVMYYIIMHPQVITKLQAEIQKFIKLDEDIKYQNIKQMIYLDCVVHECLRLYQPANGIFIRQATHDHVLDDIQIKKGTLIMTSSLSNHYNAENFQNPTQFRPQRWLSQQNTLKTPKPYTWLTFSAGGRSCLGKQLALTQLKIIVIQLLRKYKMTMETTNLTMKMSNFSYQPQKFITKFVKK